MFFVPGQTTWTQLAGVCDRAGFIDLTEALLNSYCTGEKQHSNYLTVFITKYGSTLYIGMDEVFQHHAHTFEKSDLKFHFQCEFSSVAAEW